ncbi:MAG: hypothetical protein GC200_05095 [Tepidisphaera sp.]|nr:hypothetical protein [Tepidisphaera sp.]
MTTQSGPYLSMEAAGKLYGQTEYAIWRWCRKGIKARSGQRVYLKHIRSGRRLLTTQTWLDEFHADLTREDHAGLATGASVEPKPDTQSVSAVADAQAELAAAGI